MKEGSIQVLLEAYENRAVSASQAKFPHHWLTVTSEETKATWLKVLRPGDCEKFTAPGYFVEKHGMSFLYPLSFFGFFIGFALRAVETKDMRSFVKYKKTACYTPFASIQNSLPSGGVTTIIAEGYADVEAIANFHPWVVGTVSATLRLPLFHLVASVSNRVLLMCDNDEAGRQGFARMEKRFGQLGKKVDGLNFPHKYKDPADWFLDDRKGMERKIRRSV